MAIVSRRSRKLHALDVRRGCGGRGSNRPGRLSFGTVCVAHCANPPNQAHAGPRPQLPNRAVGAAAEAVGEFTDLSALSAVLGVSASEDGLALWLCVAQPCTFSCVLLPSLASPQR